MAYGPEDYSVTSSELIADAPILALRRDTVRMPAGNDATREIVEHLGSVVVVALDDQGRVALVEQYRHAIGRRSQELPAGLLDVAGESEIDCASRELYEEAGLVAQNWSVLLDLVTSPGFSEEAVRLFLATELSSVERPEAEDEEAGITLEWVDLEQARTRIFDGEIINSIAIAGILAACTIRPEELRGTDEPFTLRPTSLARRRAGVGSDLKKLS